MRRHITLLLFIGLAWGQEYDPETGEVVIKQYDPETGELIKDQNYPDSLVSPSHPKVNSDLKNISISHLTKEQKEKYDHNRIGYGTAHCKLSKSEMGRFIIQKYYKCSNSTSNAS